jgi:two-component system, chemotaxis family, chemotaxis protein CheY
MAFSVLIVDDSPAMRSFIRRVMEISGLETSLCLEASDGAEALEVLERSWVDVVLTDINMPRMGGEQLLRRLHESELLRTLPVIVVSTDSTEVRMRQMLELGARGYVKKPFTPEMLRQEIETVLGVAHV